MIRFIRVRQSRFLIRVNPLRSVLIRVPQKSLRKNMDEAWAAEKLTDLQTKADAQRRRFFGASRGRLAISFRT